MTGYRIPFNSELQKLIKRGISHLQENHLYDTEVEGPDVVTISKRIASYLGDQRKPLPPEIDTVISLAVSGGTANEAIGNISSALAWYRIGRYIWRGNEAAFNGDQRFPDFGYRMTAGMLQMEAAICADRLGDSTAAQQLFSWAVKNRSFHESELLEFDETKQYSAVWKWTIQKAYALLCLGEDRLAQKAAEEALNWIKKDRKAKLGSATEMPLLILPTILALIHYELDPSPENRAEAVRLLDLDAVSSRIHVDHFQALFYLFNLRAKYPELAAPDDAELPPAARAQQGAEACRRWISKAGIHLDDSLESLKVLDKHIKEIYRNIQDDEQRKMALFMLGSYYGEIVRHELAGGKWNFTVDALLSWTVDWVLGEVELQFWPFQRVHEYATGKTDESLIDLWEDTEQAYIEFGLAAQFEE
jgi:hypothetical protein